jgi:type IX secretion system PorP/SprF family membrane protein
MKKIVFSILISFQIMLAAGQDLNINHYPFYRDGLNPGSFIHAPEINVILLYNNEFWGFQKEPVTFMADVSMNLHGNKLGLMVYNDNLGWDRAQNIKLRYAKRFIISQENNSSFSLGLSAGVINRVFRGTQMTFEDPTDVLHENDYIHTLPDFDFGAEFKIHDLVLGLATNHLGKPLTDFENVNPTPHYYAYGQYTFYTNLLRIKPNVMFRYWKNTYWVELGALGFYKDNFWIGGTYTNFYDLNIMTGIKILDKIHLGYSFKSNMNGRILNPWNINSNEIFINFSFGKEKPNGENTVKDMYPNPYPDFFRD